MCFKTVIITLACAFSPILLEVSATPVDYLSISDHNEYYHLKNHLLNQHYDHEEKANKKIYRTQDFITHKNKVQIQGHHDLPGKKHHEGENPESEAMKGSNLWNIGDFLNLLRNATEKATNSTSSPQDKINKVMVIVKTYKEPKIKNENSTIPIITEEAHDPKVVEIHDNGLTLNDILEANSEIDDAKMSESTNNNSIIKKLPETTTKGYEVWEFDF